MTREDVLKQLPIRAYFEHALEHSVKWNGTSTTLVTCVFHDDSRPSLSLNSETGDFHCFGCEAKGSIFDFVMLRRGCDFKEALKELADFAGVHEGADVKPKPEIETTYRYTDAKGTLLFEVVRFRPKDFKQRRPDGKGGWAWNMDGIGRVPYNLPEVAGSNYVVIVEGEKDVESLRALGVVATCNPGGVGKWKPEYNKYLQGKHVAILPDNDEPGRKHAVQVASSLNGVAAVIKVVELPGLPDKGDVSDWAKQEGNGKVPLFMAIQSAPGWEPSTDTEMDHTASQDAPTDDFPEDVVQEPDTTPEDVVRGFHFLPASNIISMPQPTTWLIKPFLDASSLSMIFGEAGSMKSFMALDQGLSIATAHDWHGGEVRQGGLVFYIAGEGFAGLNRRLKAWSIYHETDLQDVPFFVSDRPVQFLDSESAGEMIKAVEELRAQHGDPVLVIIDTLNRNFGPGDENSTQDMTQFIATIDGMLRSRYRCAVQIIHHSGLSTAERARGASALRAALDWEYRLQKNADGSRILSCTKSKDHEPPPTVSFIPETITLDGWVDPDDGEVMTSCVLRWAEGVTAATRPLLGARKVAFDALVSIREEHVHIDAWRDAAYAAGISPTSSSDAKRKAFQRAVCSLRDADLVRTTEDYWWPIR